MSDRVVKIEGDVALLAYRVLAERSNGPVCEALCSSVYILDDGAWLRMTHQQTPVA